MTRFAVTLAQLNLKPMGQDTQAAPESVFLGQMDIAGLPCHVSAYQVIKNDAGEFFAVNRSYSDELEAIVALADNNPMTLMIDGLEYVIAIYPHSN